MRISFVPLCIGFLIVLLLNGCSGSDGVDDFFKDPNPAAIESTLKTTIPVGYAASLAMAAINGDVAPNVTVANGCSAYPCNGLIYIDYNDQDYPMPIETNRIGEIIVVGLWPDADVAILTVFFTDLNFDTGTFILDNVDTFPVIRTANLIKAVYADIDVNAGSGPILTLTLTQDEIDIELDRLNTMPPIDSHVSLDEEAWIVDIDNNTTSDDFTDDVYEISGAGQFIGVSSSAAGVEQVIFIQVFMSLDCRLNPTDGFTIINDTEVSPDPPAYGLTLGTVWITFQSDCDGKAEVTAATGSYMPSTGDSIRLDLTEN